MHADDQPSGYPILEMLLAVSCTVLVLQAFPELFWGLLAIIDVRNWSWRVFATVSAIAIVSLVGIKAWLER